MPDDRWTLYYNERIPGDVECLNLFMRSELAGVTVRAARFRGPLLVGGQAQYEGKEAISAFLGQHART